MPKLQNVTEADLKEICDLAETVAHKIFDAVARIEKGYCDPVADPVEALGTMIMLGRAAGDMQAQMLHKTRMADKEREYEKLKREIAERKK